MSGEKQLEANGLLSCLVEGTAATSGNGGQRELEIKKSCNKN